MKIRRVVSGGIGSWDVPFLEREGTFRKIVDPHPSDRFFSLRHFLLLALATGITRLVSNYQLKAEWKVWDNRWLAESIGKLVLGEGSSRNCK